MGGVEREESTIHHPALDWPCNTVSRPRRHIKFPKQNGVEKGEEKWLAGGKNFDYEMNGTKLEGVQYIKGLGVIVASSLNFPALQRRSRLT